MEDVSHHRYTNRRQFVFQRVNDCLACLWKGYFAAGLFDGDFLKTLMSLKQEMRGNKTQSCALSVWFYVQQNTKGRKT